MSKYLRPIRDWIALHGSAVYICSIGSIGIIGFILGHFLKPTHPGISEVLTQVVGSLLAVALTAVFFSLSDLRNSIAESIGDLLHRGRLVEIMSRTHKDAFSKAILESRCEVPNGKIRDDFFNHLDQVTRGAITPIYYENYRFEKKLSRRSENPNLINADISRFYRINLCNGHQDGTKHRVHFQMQWSCAKKYKELPDRWCTEFTAKIGNDKYDIKHAEMTKKDEGDVVKWELLFEREIEIKNGVDVRFRVVVVNSIDDPVEMCFAKYPCHGFQLSLQFEPGLIYDTAFFGATSSNSDHFNRGDITYSNDGVSFSTSGWVLPGEGVVSYFQQKN